MIWVDYIVEQAGADFKIKGDWEGEVMGKQKNGTDKNTHLYKEGDIFVVDKNGWLRKVATKEDGYEVSTMVR